VKIFQMVNCFSFVPLIYNLEVGEEWSIALGFGGGIFAYV
jgi:hypothetical protein